MTSSVGKRFVMYVLGAEMALYIIYKIARNDFYWWPEFNGRVDIAIAIVARTMAKLVVSQRCW